MGIGWAITNFVGGVVVPSPAVLSRVSTADSVAVGLLNAAPVGEVLLAKAFISLQII